MSDIRQVTDGALYRQVMLRCWTGTVAPNSSAYRETDEGISADLARGYGVLVFLDGEPVGCGRLVPVPGPAGEPDWVELKRMGVLREHRKQGLAVPMIAALEAEAIRRGAHGAQIGVREDQPRLVRFWEGLGYRIAHDVQLSNPNPLTPPPTHLRKRFAA